MRMAPPAGGLFTTASGRRKVLHRTSNFKLQQEPFRFNPDQGEDSKKKIPLHGRKNAERFLLRARSARGAPIQGVRFPSRTATEEERLHFFPFLAALSFIFTPTWHIYVLPLVLTELEGAPKEKTATRTVFFFWCTFRDSNPGPTD